MNIRCPHCQTVFRVNPERIPASGVRAKCARCGDTFVVTPPSATASATSAAPASRAPAAAPAAQPVAPPPAAPPSPPQAAPTPPPLTAPAPRVAEPSRRPPSPAPAAVGTAAPSPRPAAAAPRPAPAAATPAASTATAPAAAAFGTRDPRARAERLARALVSDIVAYHRERRDRSLESGRLRAEFREEIMKSWDEYVAQVGLDVAKSTPYFRDALNTILAKGVKLF